jgi:hypothetical protein
VLGIVVKNRVCQQRSCFNMMRDIAAQFPCFNLNKIVSTKQRKENTLDGMIHILWHRRVSASLGLHMKLTGRTRFARQVTAIDLSKR